MSLTRRSVEHLTDCVVELLNHRHIHQWLGGVWEWSLVSATALIWGSSFVWIDIALESFRPRVITAFRILVGTATVSLMPAARKPVDSEDLPRIAFLGLIWVGIPLSLAPIAQQWIDSSVAGMLLGALPVATMAWSMVLLRRWPKKTQMFGAHNRLRRHHRDLVGAVAGFERDGAGKPCGGRKL